MKILLINPPWYRFFGKAFTAHPIGLCYIAALLEVKGYDVSVYNSDYNKRKSGELIMGDIASMESYEMYPLILDDMDNPLWKEISSVIASQSPDIVGISSMTGQYGPAQNIARIVKGQDKDIPVIFGGVHPTVLPDETLANDEVDVVVRGEGEYSFLEVVEKISSGGSFDDVLGISFKNGDDQIHNKVRPLIEDLDDLPFPARHLLLEKETYPPFAFGNIIASRGCPYNCIFCEPYQVWTKKVRYRSPENVIEEIKQVQKEYNTNFFYFNDADFLIKKRYVSEVCDLIDKEGLIIDWCCEARAGELDDNIAKKMMLSGCDHVYVGVESGDEEMLKRIKKGTTIEEIRDTRRVLLENAIGFNGMFLIGFPWETEEAVRKTISFMQELDPDFASFNCVAPYPGTELNEMYSSNEIIKNIDWRYFFHQRPRLELNENVTEDEAIELIKDVKGAFRAQNKKRKMNNRSIG